MSGRWIEVQDQGVPPAKSNGCAESALSGAWEKVQEARTSRTAAPDLADTTQSASFTASSSCTEASWEMPLISWVTP